MTTHLVPTLPELALTPTHPALGLVPLGVDDMPCDYWSTWAGDLRPLRATLTQTDPDDATATIAIDLTGLTVGFHYRTHPTGAWQAGGGTVTLVDAANGVVEYAWAAGETDDAGRYDYLFEVDAGSYTYLVPEPSQVEDGFPRLQISDGP